MARYLIDANLPRLVPRWSNAEFVFVVDLDATWADRRIWDFATGNNLTIVTKDADFTDRAFVTPGGPKVIHFRVGNRRFQEFREFVDRNWDRICRLSDEHQLVQVFRDFVECMS